MRRINPEILRNERVKQGWTIDDLAEKSKIDRQSIHRIENGSKKRNRQKVIQNLAKALGISEEILTGASAPASHEEKLDKRDVLFNRSQLNLRISNQARNALYLASLKFGMTQSQIVEIAPLLFCWAAEKSLKKRGEFLIKFEELAKQRELVNPSHLNHAKFDRSEDVREAEKESIKKGDIFGLFIRDNTDEELLSQDYNESIDNPFASFMEHLANEIGEDVSFEGWSPHSSPEYCVCKTVANTIAGGDEVATDEILEGNSPVYQLEDDLDFFKLSKEERAKRVRDAASASREKYFTTIGLGE